MIKNLDEVMEKIKGIKEEMDVIEYRVINTRTHVESIENTVKKISKEILEGFHGVSSKINNLENIVKKLEKELDEIYKRG